MFQDSDSICISWTGTFVKHEQTPYRLNQFLPW